MRMGMRCLMCSRVPVGRPVPGARMVLRDPPGLPAARGLPVSGGPPVSAAPPGQRVRQGRPASLVPQVPWARRDRWACREKRGIPARWDLWGHPVLRAREGHRGQPARRVLRGRRAPSAPEACKGLKDLWGLWGPRARGVIPVKRAIRERLALVEKPERPDLAENGACRARGASRGRQVPSGRRDSEVHRVRPVPPVRWGPRARGACRESPASVGPLAWRDLVAPSARPVPWDP